jgi:hypothetical protein
MLYVLCQVQLKNQFSHGKNVKSNTINKYNYHQL